MASIINNPIPFHPRQLGSTLLSAYYEYGTSSQTTAAGNTDIGHISLDSTIALPSASHTTITGFDFANNGLSLYVADSGDDTIKKYVLPAAYDTSTLNGLSPLWSFSVASRDGTIRGIRVDNTETVLYGLGDDGNYVIKWTVDPLSGLTYVNRKAITALVTPNITNPRDLYVASDQSFVIVVDDGTDKIYKLTMTSGDVSTLADSGDALSISSQTSAPRGIALLGDSFTDIYLLGSTKIFQYTAASAGVLAGATNTGKQVTVSAVDSSPQGLRISADKLKLFFLGQTGKNINKYTQSSVTKVTQINDLSGNNNHATVTAVYGAIDTGSGWKFGQGYMALPNVSAKAFMIVLSSVNGGSTTDSAVIASNASGNYIYFTDSTQTINMGGAGGTTNFGSASINGGDIFPTAQNGASATVTGLAPFPNRTQKDIIYVEIDSAATFTALGGLLSSSRYANYTVHAVLGFTSAIGNSVKEKLEGYFAHKIENNLAVTHPYKYKKAWITNNTPRYTASTIAAADGQSGRLHGVTATGTQILALIDALVAAHPTYITKTNKGKDGSDTYDIFSYDFNPGNATKKVIITCGVQKEAAQIAIVLARFLEDLCNNYSSDPILNYIRHNVRLVILPVINIYAFNENSSGNKYANLVWSNLNYPLEYGGTDYWAAYVAANPGENCGASAGSEPETQIVIDIIDTHDDADFLLDIHGARENGHTEEEYQFDELTAGTSYTNVISRVITDLNAQYTNYKINSNSTASSDTTPTIRSYAFHMAGIPRCHLWELNSNNSSTDASQFTSSYMTRHVNILGNLLWQLSR